MKDILLQWIHKAIEQNIPIYFEHDMFKAPDNVLGEQRQCYLDYHSYGGREPDERFPEIFDINRNFNQSRDQGAILTLDLKHARNIVISSKAAQFNGITLKSESEVIPELKIETQ